MWFTSSFFCYFITAIIGSVIFIFFSRKFKKLLKKFKKKNVSLRILAVADRQECQEACLYLKAHCQDLSALGFDCEWVSINGEQRPVALLQLASVHGLCCLFRLNLLGEIPSELQEILQNREILKLGISPLNDSNLLRKDYNVQVCSTLDLRYLYPTDGGLATLAASVIGVYLRKHLWLKCSDWESPILTDSQIDYAAKDALIAVEIFKKWLTSNNDTYNSCSETQYGKYFNETLKFKISKYLDIYFKPAHFPEKSNKKIITQESNNIQNQIKIKSSYATRKTPLYHNCFMHAPDGELLCSCDKRKAQWYLDRGLAEVLLGEPYSIRLLFEPTARAGKTNGERFYQQLKQNCCVVCGALQSYLKHNVVPKEYRRHFPKIMKDHQSHDIVLMCVKCHYLAAQHNEVLRQKLALICNAPIKNTKVSQIKTIKRVQNCAKALLTAGDQIPQERKIELENQVKKYFEVDFLTMDLLKKTVKLKSNVVNENYESHGFKVVNYFIKECNELTKLEILWREHFLNKMKPQYLPALWSVSHNHSRLAAIANKNQV